MNKKFLGITCVLALLLAGCTDPVQPSSNTTTEEEPTTTTEDVPTTTTEEDSGDTTTSEEELPTLAELAERLAQLGNGVTGEVKSIAGSTNFYQNLDYTFVEGDSGYVKLSDGTNTHYYAVNEYFEAPETEEEDGSKYFEAQWGYYFEDEDEYKEAMLMSSLAEFVDEEYIDYSKEDGQFMSKNNQFMASVLAQLNLDAFASRIQFLGIDISNEDKVIVNVFTSNEEGAAADVSVELVPGEGRYADLDAYIATVQELPTSPYSVFDLADLADSNEGILETNDVYDLFGVDLSTHKYISSNGIETHYDGEYYDSWWKNYADYGAGRGMVDGYVNELGTKFDLGWYAFGVDKNGHGIDQNAGPQADTYQDNGYFNYFEKMDQYFEYALYGYRTNDFFYSSAILPLVIEEFEDGLFEERNGAFYLSDFEAAAELARCLSVNSVLEDVLFDIDNYDECLDENGNIKIDAELHISTVAPTEIYMAYEVDEESGDLLNLSFEVYYKDYYRVQVYNPETGSFNLILEEGFKEDSPNYYPVTDFVDYENAIGAPYCDAFNDELGYINASIVTGTDITEEEDAINYSLIQMNHGDSIELEFEVDYDGAYLEYYVPSAYADYVEVIYGQGEDYKQHAYLHALDVTYFESFMAAPFYLLANGEVAAVAYAMIYPVWIGATETALYHDVYAGMKETVEDLFEWDFLVTDEDNAHGELIHSENVKVELETYFIGEVETMHVYGDTVYYLQPDEEQPLSALFGVVYVDGLESYNHYTLVYVEHAFEYGLLYSNLLFELDLEMELDERSLLHVGDSLEAFSYYGLAAMIGLPMEAYEILDNGSVEVSDAKFTIESDNEEVLQVELGTGNDAYTVYLNAASVGEANVYITLDIGSYHYEQFYEFKVETGNVIISYYYAPVFQVESLYYVEQLALLTVQTTAYDFEKMEPTEIIGVLDYQQSVSYDYVSNNNVMFADRTDYGMGYYFETFETGWVAFLARSYDEDGKLLAEDAIYIYSTPEFVVAGWKLGEEEEYEPILDDYGFAKEFEVTLYIDETGAEKLSLKITPSAYTWDGDILNVADYTNLWDQNTYCDFYSEGDDDCVNFLELTYGENGGDIFMTLEAAKEGKVTFYFYMFTANDYVYGEEGWDPLFFILTVNVIDNTQIEEIN